MGLALKQRNWLTTRNHGVRCFGGCTSFKADHPELMMVREKKGTGAVRAFFSRR